MNPQNLKIWFYAIGNVIPRIISLILISMLSFFLSKAEMGVYDLLLNAISLFTPILLLQLGEACYRWIYGQSEYKVADILKTVLIFLLGFNIFLFFLLEWIIYYFQLKFEISFLYVLFSTAIFTLFQAIARALNHTKVYAISGILNSITILLLTLFYFYTGAKNIDSLVKSYIFANLLSFVYILFYVNLKKVLIEGIYNPLVLKELLKYALPLIPATISWWIVYFANRYIILWTLGVEANGMYAVAARIPSLLLLINYIFSLGFQDSLLIETNEIKDVKAYSQLFKMFFTFQMTFAIVVFACIKQITAFLFSNLYVESYKITVLLITGTLLSNFANFFGNFYLQGKNTMNLLKTIFISAVINIMFTYWTINHLGLYGAAFGMILSFGALWYFRYQYVKKTIQITLDYKFMIALSVIFVLVLCSVYVPNFFVEIGIIMISFYLFYFYNPFIFNKLYAKFR